MLQFFKQILNITNTDQGFTRLDVAAFTSGLANKGISLIDVRSLQEYKSGKIANATLINIMSANFKTQLNQLNKENPLYIYCRSGVRSQKAAKQAVKLGFKEVYDLKGGIIAFQK